MKAWIFFFVSALAFVTAAHAQNWNAVTMANPLDGATLAQWDESAARAHDEPSAESSWPYGPEWCRPAGWHVEPGGTYLQADGKTHQREMVATSDCNWTAQKYGTFTTADYIVYTCVNNTRWAWFKPAQTWLCQSGYYISLRGDDPPGGDCACDQGRIATAYPIELGTGNMSESATDFSSGDGRLRLERYYNSNPEMPLIAGRGWKNAFDARRIVTADMMTKAVLPDAPAPFAASSAVYSSASDACVKGIADVAQDGEGNSPPNPKYQGVTAVYLGNGQCQLSSGEVIPVLSTIGAVAYGPSVPDAVAAVVALRPDGKGYGFTCFNGTCRAVGQGRPRLVANSKGFVLTAENGDQETYDINGVLKSIVSRDGYTLTLTRNSDGTVRMVADSHGRQLRFAYNANSLLSTLTLPDQKKITYAYNVGGNLTSVTYPDGSVVRYEYGHATFRDALTAWTDESSARYVTWQYNAAGKAIASALAGDVEASSLTYDGDTTTLVDSLGASRAYHFQEIAGGMRLVSVNGPLCRECAGRNMTYDANGYLKSAQDWLGNQTLFQFDETGLLGSKTEAVGSPEQRREDIAWNTSLRVPLSRTIRDAGNQALSTEQWSYNVRGQPLAHCDVDPTTAGNYTCSASGNVPAGVRRWTYTYCDAVGSNCPLIGLLLSVSDPRSDVSQVTTYSYYSSSSAQACGTPGAACHQIGDLFQVTNAMGQVTTYASYDANGRVTRLTDSNGVNIDITYTPRGWLATLSTDGGVTRFSYTPYGAISALKDPDGVLTSFTYDAAHRLTDITDGTGARIHYTLDSAGNRTAEQVFSPAGAVVRSVGRSFNALGQLTAITDGLNRTVFSASYPDSYDANGNLVHSQDGLGVQRKQAFDGLNRLVATIQDYQGSNAATKDAQSVTSYDALDRVTGFSDPDGLNTTYDIDAFGNVTGQHSPDTGTTTRTYDIAGNRITSTDATNVASTSTFDALNRVLTTSYADSSLNIQYKYDEDDAVTGCTGNYGKGHLTRIIEANGGLAWCYDARGNVLRKQQTVGTTTTTTTYTWTPGNRLASLTTPNGTLIAYARDVVGNITTVTATPPGGTPTTVVSNVVYMAFGPIASYTLGNGQTVTRSYDAAGNLTDIDSTAFSLHMKRDVLGNITAIGDAPGVATPTETYSYDALYRLTGFQGADGSPIESYSYNKTGDRLSKTGPGTLTGNYSYAPGTHHLTAVGTTTREVDARGNTTANVLATGSYGYGYNQRNRLTVVQKDGVTVGSYVLNALGQRVQKTAGGVTTRFDYDENSRLLSESAGGGSRDYIWLDELPVGFVDRGNESSTLNYVYADGLGTPRAVTDITGNVLWHWEYAQNPFGDRPPANADAITMNTRFPGQYYDAESGLLYNLNRHYEPEAGRYTQADPIGLRGGVSAFSYGFSKPLTFADPLGLSGILVINSSGSGDGSSGSGGVSGHSWISYTPDGGQMSTYGTWGNNPQGLPNGLEHNLELGRIGDATRAAHLTDEEEAKLYDVVKSYEREGESAWGYLHPCSSFAADAWNSSTGESLNPNGPYSNPSSLKQSIIDANGGRNHGTIGPMPHSP